MKKILIVFSSLLIVFSLAGCGKNRNADNNATNNNATNNNAETPVENNADQNTTTNDQNTAGETKVELADEIADEVTTLPDVESATVMVTNQNAYVGAQLKNGAEGTADKETEIADEVRKTHSEFNNVYVSLNPDFAKQMTDYGEKIRAGEPVEGFFEELSDSFRRMFPDAK